MKYHRMLAVFTSGAVIFLVGFKNAGVAEFDSAWNAVEFVFELVGMFSWG